MWALDACSEAQRRSEAHLELGKIRHKQRNYRRAVQELQKATDLNPDSMQASAVAPCISR